MKRKGETMNRRDATRNLMLMMAGSPLARAFQNPPPLPERMPGLDDLVNVFEFETVMRRNVTKNAYDFIAGGVDDEWTLRRNRQGFERYVLRPRFLTDVSNLDLSLDLFGSRIEMPILVAPTAAHQLAHPEGELATIRGAGAVKTIMVVSNNASYPIDKVAAAAVGPFWYQLYAGPDFDATQEKVERAVAAGAKVVCFTVDTQYNSHRERLLRNRVPGGMLPPGTTEQAPARTRQRGAQTPNKYRLAPTFTAQLTWPFLEELKKYAKVPVIVKGLMTGEDAKLAVKYGADGIVVSNHGGRYLETAPSTIEVLPEVVAAVGGKIPVLVDGGFRRGTDVLKALAIGARAVLVGRPPLWGLGAYGHTGVQKVLELLQTELALAMGLSGRANLKAIDRTLIQGDK